MFAASRKTAFCVRFLTEKRILHEAVRETPRTYGNDLAQAMATPKHSAAMTQVMQMGSFALSLYVACHYAYKGDKYGEAAHGCQIEREYSLQVYLRCLTLTLTRVKMPARMAMIAITLPYILLSTDLPCSISSRIFMLLNNMV